jgi:transcription termination factor Rho
MSIFDRDSLQGSSLADLHAIASELSIDGYRRLRKEQLVEAILERQGGEGEAKPDAAPAEAEPEDAPPPRRRRGGRGRRRPAEPSPTSEDATAEAQTADEMPPTRASSDADASPPEPDQVVEGVVELLPGGSGFVRVNPPEPSDQDVYVSAAQVRRCELVSGDRISGPRRPPRRAERFPSLVRVDTVNDQPASQIADGPRFDDLPAGFPDERLRLGSEDPTIKAVEWLAPIGRGSRAAIVGPPRAGKSEALRRLARELVPQDDLQVWLVLAGVRPEEVAEWASIVEPSAVAPLGASAEARSQAVEVVIEQVRRLVARGANAVVLIDSLEGVHPHVAARALASARNVVGGGSLTVIATEAEPRGGETTVITLDAILSGAGRFPALDLVESWTMRAELLVGEAAAEAILRARAEALE